MVGREPGFGRNVHKPKLPHHISNLGYGRIFSLGVSGTFQFKTNIFRIKTKVLILENGYKDSRQLPLIVIFSTGKNT